MIISVGNAYSERMFEVKQLLQIIIYHFNFCGFKIYQVVDSISPVLAFKRINFGKYFA